MDFEAVLSEDMGLHYIDLLAEASAHGQAEALIQAWREARGRLEAGSLRGVERVYRTPTGCPVYHLVVRPLSIHYVVYIAQRMAWVVRMDRLRAPDERA